MLVFDTSLEEFDKQKKKYIYMFQQEKNF